MAPNVKQLALLSQQLENLDIVQSKFLPLTHPSQEELEFKYQEELNKGNEQQTETPISFSYWDWPSDNDDDSSRSNDLFSASNIETNLIAAADNLRGKSDDSVVHSNTTENYWEEKVEENPEKSRLIGMITEEERLRNMLSIQHVELVEQNSASERHIISSCQSLPDDHLTTEENENSRRYWEWSEYSDSESYWVM